MLNKLVTLGVLQIVRSINALVELVLIKPSDEPNAPLEELLGEVSATSFEPCASKTHWASKVSLSNLLPCELELELPLPEELDLKSHIYGQRHLCAWKHQKKEHNAIESKSHKNQASIYLQAWLQNFRQGKPKHHDEANEPNRAKVQMARGTDYVHQP